jgi:predicted membrane chloride channel (bestrophin family)
MSVLLAELPNDPATSYMWFACSEEVRRLTEIIGTCEAIAGTPVPISYSRHSSRVVSMFTLMLPLALVGIMDSIPGTVVSTTIISWFLFGIEVIGHNIEEPFGLGGVRRPELLPLRRYSDNIILDLQEENRIIERALRSASKEKEEEVEADKAAPDTSRIGVSGPVGAGEPPPEESSSSGGRKFTA